jgi:uncharacterized protein (DUF488 family)
MKLYTVGFTKKSAEKFFRLLRDHDVNCLIDIRIHPDSQLSGFAKGDDLAYFLRQLVSCEYYHLVELAPTEEILGDYRKDHDWERYVERFECLMDERNIPHSLSRALFETNICCLLCSEATPEQCHRRLIAERIQRQWDGVEIIHLF